MADTERPSPLPWKIRMSTTTHYSGSPLCKDRCGKGEIPKIVPIAPSPAWPDSVGHELVSDESVDDIVDANGDHVVCTGHDYDDGGYVSLPDAEFIVRACNAHQALVDALDDLLDRYESLVISGDCGNWNPEHDDVVIKGNAALALARGLAGVSGAETVNTRDDRCENCGESVPIGLLYRTDDDVELCFKCYQAVPITQEAELRIVPKPLSGRKLFRK